MTSVSVGGAANQKKVKKTLGQLTGGRLLVWMVQPQSVVACAFKTRRTVKMIGEADCSCYIDRNLAM